MTNKIGAKIKLLRKKSDITQDKMAEYLNITPQAISRWESGNGYPDIELLPTIANFFSVSTDELLGVDIAKNEEKIVEILDLCAKYSTIGDRTARFKLMTEALILFPTDYRILNKYTSTLLESVYSNETGDLIVSESEFSESRNKAISICNRILDDCSDDEIRYDTMALLVIIYTELKDDEKAKKIANRLPHYFESCDENLEHILSGDEYAYQLQKNIETTCDLLQTKIKHNALYVQTDNRLKIKLFKKALALIDLIYDDGDYNFYSCYICDLNYEIGNCYLELFENENAIGCFIQCLEYAMMFDDLPYEKVHTSILVNKMVYKKENTTKGYLGTKTMLELKYLSDKKYDILLENKEYNSIVQKAKKRDE